MHVSIFLAHREWLLLVGEEDSVHLKICASAVTTIFSHAVVAKDDESRVVVHLLNHLLNKLFSVKEFTSDL